MTTKYRSLVRVNSITRGKVRVTVPGWNPWETVGVNIGQFPNPEHLIEKLEDGDVYYFAMVNLGANNVQDLEFEDWEETDIGDELEEYDQLLEDNRPFGYAIGDQGYPNDYDIKSVVKGWVDEKRDVNLCAEAEDMYGDAYRDALSADYAEKFGIGVRVDPEPCSVGEPIKITVDRDTLLLEIGVIIPVLDTENLSMTLGFLNQLAYSQGHVTVEKPIVVPSFKIVAKLDDIEKDVEFKPLEFTPEERGYLENHALLEAGLWPSRETIIPEDMIRCDCCDLGYHPDPEKWVDEPSRYGEGYSGRNLLKSDLTRCDQCGDFFFWDLGYCESCGEDTHPPGCECEECIDDN